MTSNLPWLHQVYLVCWDDVGIVKAGITGRNRWRAFVNRGARLVKLYSMPGSDEMYDLETQFHLDLDYNGVRAFDSAGAAQAYLGGGGGGYLECYRIPKHRIEHMLKVMIEHVPDCAIELMPQWAIEHHAPSTSTDVTDVRTNEESGSVLDQSLRKQRAGVIGIASRWELRMTASYAAAA